MEFYSSLDASQLDAESPTLFELISANQLEALLSPSLRYVLVHYAVKYPKYLLKLANRFDELNLALRVALEWYFVHYWHGLFTENFYGIKRVQRAKFPQVNARLSAVAVSKLEERRKLSDLQKFVTVFEVAGSGYISEKFGYCYERWYPKYLTKQLKPLDPNSRIDVLKTEFKKQFVRCYPWLKSGIRAANLATTLLYLSGTTKSPTLLTYLFKISFSRLNQHDYDINDPIKIKERQKRSSRFSDDNNVNRIRPPTGIEVIMKMINSKMLSPSWKVIRFIMGSFFPLIIFGLKFLEWWNNSDFTRKIAKSLGNLLEDMLPPPSIISKKREQLEQDKLGKIYQLGKLCPLCHEEISNPAIIETGHVFCYSCIYQYLSNSHKLGAKGPNGHSDSESEMESDVEKGPSPVKKIDIKRGGRCPVTGKRLLGCKWNELKQEWDIEGIRRLMF